VLSLLIRVRLRGLVAILVVVLVTSLAERGDGNREYREKGDGDDEWTECETLQF
jgi:hypothetical protein